jgi:hypothetical protein
MQDFLYRTITEEVEVKTADGDTVKVAVWRTRNSRGVQNIVIEFGGQRIEFCETEYEQHARLVADLLVKVCKNPCALPEPPAFEE